MKQMKIIIDDPLIRRQCSWGTCDNDFAYRIDDNDFCYAHGAMILEERMRGSPIKKEETTEQLELK